MLYIYKYISYIFVIIKMGMYIKGIDLMLIVMTCYTIDHSLRMKRQTIDDSASYRRKGGPTGRKLELES